MEKNKIEREGWVAREERGCLWCYVEGKPQKAESFGEWIPAHATDEAFYIENWGMGAPPLPDVKWRDEEPTRVKITIEKI